MSFYSPVTINHLKVPSVQTDFPVLVSFTDNRFRSVANGGNVQNANGYDIRPYSNAALTIPLSYDLERYNAVTGEVVMWVKIPSLSSTADTVIYLTYGTPNFTSDGSSIATWSNGFKAVYHLKDGTTLSLADSLGVNNGTNHGATAATGQVDGGANLASASSQYIDLGSGVNVPAMTYSAWINAASFPNANNAVMGYNDGSHFFVLYVKSNGKLHCEAGGPGFRNFYDGNGNGTLVAGTWYYLTLRYDTALGLQGLVNNAVDGSGGGGFVLTSTGISTLIGNGSDPNNAGGFWNGALDEVRIASVSRPTNWTITEYNNQSSPSTFETLGTEVRILNPTVAESVALVESVVIVINYAHAPTAVETLTLSEAIARGFRRTGTLTGALSVSETISTVIHRAYTNRFTISIDPTKCGASDSANFVVLFNSTHPNFRTVANGGLVQNPNGFDLNFLDAAGQNLLPWEVERYNPVTGELVAWVLLPNLSHTVPTQFALEYGSPSITTDQSSAAGTFPSPFQSVQHFRDGTTLHINDSTGHTSWTQYQPANPPHAVAGQIDGAVLLDSTVPQYVITPGPGPSAPAMTVSAWCYLNSFAYDYNPIVTRGSSGTDYLGLYIKSNGKIYAKVVTVTGTPPQYDGTGLFTLTLHVWYHIVLTYDASTGLYVYVNAVLDKNVPPTVAAYTGDGNATTVGQQGGTRFFNGAFDEVRWQSVARSPDWILAEYNNQSSPGTFYSLGSPGVACMESLGTSEVAAAFRTTVGRAVTESLLTAESVQGVHGLNSLASDAPHTAEAATRTIVQARSTQEFPAISETLVVTALHLLARDAQDLIILSDSVAVSVHVGLLTGSAQDAPTVSEALSTSQVLIRSIAEVLNTRELAHPTYGRHFFCLELLELRFEHAIANVHRGYSTAEALATFDQATEAIVRFTELNYYLDLHILPTGNFVATSNLAPEVTD